MILPNVRASFGSTEVEVLLRLLGGRSPGRRSRWEERLAVEGLDVVLDHPETLSAVMDGGGVRAIPTELVFYVMVRHTLLESGLEDANIADYVAALIIEFATGERAHRIAHYDDKSYRYLVDLVADLENESSERRQFLLRAHIGNYALWLSGLFPDYVIARVRRTGAPGLEYYEELGSTGFLMASESDLADHFDLATIYRQVATAFSEVRGALNKASDRYFFPYAPSPVDRLLRRLADEHRAI